MDSIKKDHIIAGVIGGLVSLGVAYAAKRIMCKAR